RSALAARRTIPAWLMRVLRRRDGVCQFPGCSRRRWLQGHHVKHWADAGPTNLDNLLLTCRPHHKLVHEFGWTVARGPAGHATSVPAERPGLRSRAAGAASRGAPVSRSCTASVLSLRRDYRSSACATSSRWYVASPSVTSDAFARLK